MHDIGIHVADTAIQVQGGTGYIEESGAPQFLRDSRITAIYEGTNGIQALDLVGRKVARDGGDAVRALTDIILSSDKALAMSGSVDVQVIRSRLAIAVTDLTSATNWLIDTYPSDPTRVAAGSVFYLRLLGNVVSGWLMAKAAAKAAEQLKRGSDAFFSAS